MTDNLNALGRASNASSLVPPSPKVGPMKTPAIVPSMDLPGSSLDDRKLAFSMMKGSMPEAEFMALDPIAAAAAPVYGGFKTYAPAPEVDDEDDDYYDEDGDEEEDDGVGMDFNGGKKKTGAVPARGPAFTQAVDRTTNAFVPSADKLVGGSLSLNSRNVELAAARGSFCGSPMLTGLIGSLQSGKK